MVDFNANREAWQTVIKNTSPMRPNVGKRVKVIGGKKYLGKVGIVRWHGVNKMSDAWRYGDSAKHAMSEIMGRYGYRVKIETDSGESFFIDADRVEVIDTVLYTYNASMQPRTPAQTKQIADIVDNLQWGGMRLTEYDLRWTYEACKNNGNMPDNGLFSAMPEPAQQYVESTLKIKHSKRSPITTVSPRAGVQRVVVYKVVKIISITDMESNWGIRYGTIRINGEKRLVISRLQGNNTYSQWETL